MLKCQCVSISKTCHFPVTLTPRAKIEQGLRAEVFLSFSDDFMGVGGEARSPEWIESRLGNMSFTGTGARSHIFFPHIQRLV